MEETAILFFVVSLCFQFSLAKIPLDYQEACRKVSINESHVSEWILKRYPTHHWERPVKNGMGTVKVLVKMAISDFPQIVSFQKKLVKIIPLYKKITTKIQG